MRIYDIPDDTFESEDDDDDEDDEDDDEDDEESSDDDGMYFRWFISSYPVILLFLKSLLEVCSQKLFNLILIQIFLLYRYLYFIPIGFQLLLMFILTRLNENDKRVFVF